MPPLSLSDIQLNLIQQASSLLAPQARDSFLRSICNRLDNVADPTDHDISTAINFVLGCQIGGGPRAFIQPKQPKGYRHEKRSSKVFQSGQR